MGQEQQIIAMQQYENMQNLQKWKTDYGDDDSGMFDKLKNPFAAFNKLKIFNKSKKNQDEKRKNNVQQNQQGKYFDDLQKAKEESMKQKRKQEEQQKRLKYLDDLEKAKQESLKLAATVPKEVDFLNLGSMEMHLNDDVKVDENDPFSSLINEYKNDKTAKVIQANYNLDLPDLDNIGIAENVQNDSPQMPS